MADTPHDLQRASADLDYVRSIVRRAEDRSGIPSIYFLWAILCLPGMAIIDADPHYAGPYWAVAGPLGGLLSWFLAARAARKYGLGSQREGILNAIQWAGFMGTILLLTPMIASGALHGVTISRVILLFIGFAYLSGGNYLDRRLRWVALVVYAGYGLTFALDAYAWTVVGAIMSGSLVAAGLLTSRAIRDAA